MKSPSFEPVSIQNLGQPFFRQYMAKYPEVFQRWILEVRGYEYTESYQGKLFPHLTEVPVGFQIPYEIDDEKSEEISLDSNTEADNEENQEDDSSDNDFPDIDLSKVPEFVYFANLRHKGKTKYCGAYLQMKWLEENDLDLTETMMRDHNYIYFYTDSRRVLQVILYVGDYPFYSPTRKDDLFFIKFSCTVTDLTQMRPKKITKHPDFHIHILSMFNHLMPDDEKVDFIIQGMLRIYHQRGTEEAEYYFHLLELTETPKNRPTLNRIFDQLANTPEYQHLQRSLVYPIPPKLDEIEETIMLTIIDKTITLMYRQNIDALKAAHIMNLNALEYQTLLNRLAGIGEVITLDTLAR